MIKKKNGFLTFIFSLIPGAGEMYLGFMKEGISIMGTTTVLFAIAMSWGIELAIMCLPLIWFYSFFNVHNKASLSDEEFYTLEDDYLFHMDRIIPNGNLTGRQMKVFGWILILFGIMIIWHPAIQSILAALRVYISPDFAAIVGNFLYKLPQYVVAAVLIICGIKLIRYKKKELELEEKN